tara:strand:+ start:682 stop:903 length:222 start_codon:yes stop_codon:yes gene_type:complete
LPDPILIPNCAAIPEALEEEFDEELIFEILSYSGVVKNCTFIIAKIENKNVEKTISLICLARYKNISLKNKYS